MRSYEAARTYFSILSFVSWCIILLGGIVAFIAMAAMGQMSRSFGGSSMAGLTGLLPGIVVMFSGFIGLVFAQIGRAGVDTAEYTQQMLKIARDQLEVSKQGLRSQHQPPQTFTETKKGPGTPGKSSFSNSKPKPSPKPVEKPPVELSVLSEGEQINHQGNVIERKEGRYLVKGMSFDTLQMAKRHVEHVKR